MNDQVWWYATRAAGLMTWSTAVASVIVGLLLSTRAVKSRTGPWMLDLHRFLGGLSVLFLVVHMGTLYLDSFEHFGPGELFIPGESTWNPEAAAWGIIAMYALVLVELTSLLRKHISQSVWRTFHMLSIVTAAAGTYHAVLGGSDVDNPLTWVVAGAGSAIVIALIALRLKGAEQPTNPRAEKANDREALLQEMRDRLETLPVSADAPQAELTTDGAQLPRREPSATPTVPAGPAAGAFGNPAAPAPASLDAMQEPANPFAAPITRAGEAEPVHDDPFRPAAPTPSSYDEIANTGLRVADPFGRGHGSASEPADAVTAPTHSDPYSNAPASPDPFGAATMPEPTPAMETPIPPAASPFLDPADLSHASGPSPFTEPAPAFDPASPFGSEPAPGAAPNGSDPHPDPFASTAPADPFAEPPTHERSEPATEPFASAPTPADPFATQPDIAAPSPADPFATQPVPAPSNPFAAQPAAPAPGPADPFGSTQAPAPADPFGTTQAPVPADPFAAASTATAPPPPPVPDAVDPATGEPDQAAYTAWLVEWLAYAEKYGEETPEDPSRVF